MSPIIIYKWAVPIVVAVVSALLIRKFFFFVTLVSSYSMYPILKPKDLVLTVRIHNFHNIKRGDILSFYSEELHKMMIKRVIGLPYDFIEIENDGTAYINQEKFDEPYADYPSRLNGKFQVPAKKYLFLGDNRACSNDSRSWINPFISEKDIQGKAILCMFPFHRT